MAAPDTPRRLATPAPASLGNTVRRRALRSFAASALTTVGAACGGGLQRDPATPTLPRPSTQAPAAIVGTPTIPAAALATAQAGGARLYPLPGLRVFPEGIAYDVSSKTFFVGSSADGTLYRGDVASGAVTVFSPVGTDGRLTVLGLEVDAARRRLWVAGGAAQRMWVYAIEPAALIRRYDVPPGTPPALINDVVVMPAGDAYFTDTTRPVLWRIAGAGGPSGGPGELEPWLALGDSPIPYGPRGNLNGIVATPDGAYLIVVHSTSGELFRIALATKEITKIDAGAVFEGGDGLALDGRALYIVHNGQITRVGLAADYLRGAVEHSYSSPSLAVPTTLRKVDDRLLIVNSQLDAQLPGRSPALPFTVVSVPVPT